MQSDVLALARVVFAAPEMYDLALLQRHGRVLKRRKSPRLKSSVSPATGPNNNRSMSEQDSTEQNQSQHDKFLKLLILTSDEEDDRKMNHTLHSLKTRILQMNRLKPEISNLLQGVGPLP